jgi:hypothetical protein
MIQQNRCCCSFIITSKKGEGFVLRLFNYNGMTNDKRYVQTWTAERIETREAFQSCMHFHSPLCTSFLSFYSLYAVILYICSITTTDNKH